MKDRTTILLIVALVVLVVAGAIFGRNPHPKFPWHGWPGFQAVVGVAAAIVVSVIAKWLAFKVLYRPEDDE